ncbi:hypothetical protein HDU98_000956 [Podochytrium sp. JEL0797]|nr:hypothetical protein HDU98_000956 [Podochytrium sp. JEL0797]
MSQGLSSSSGNALQTAFMPLVTAASFNYTLSGNPPVNLTTPVYGNWIPLCPPTISTTGTVFQAVSDTNGHAHITMFNPSSNSTNATSVIVPSASPIQVAFGNLPDTTDLPMAYLNNDDKSPSGTFLHGMAFDSTGASDLVHSFSFPFLSNFEDFRPVATSTQVFTLAATPLGIPCALRITFGTQSAIDFECQPFTAFGTSSIHRFMELTLVDPQANQLLISADDYGYITTWDTLPSLAASTNPSLKVGNANGFTRLRSIPATPTNIFTTFVVSIDATSTVRYFGVPAVNSPVNPWFLVWIAGEANYPVLGEGGAVGVGFDVERQWIYICANAKQGEGRLLALTPTYGDLVWGGDSSGSISCARDSVVVLGGGGVVASQAGTGKVGMYRFYDYHEKREVSTVVEWEVAGDVYAPYAFRPVVWKGVGREEEGVIVVGTLGVGFGGVWEGGVRDLNGGGVIPRIQVVEEVRPVRNFTFVVQATPVSTAGSTSVLQTVGVVVGASPTATGGSGGGGVEVGGVERLGGGVIAVIVLAILFALGLVVCACLWHRKKKQVEGERKAMAGGDIDAVASASSSKAPKPSQSPDIQTNLTATTLPAQAPITAHMILIPPPPASSISGTYVNNQDVHSIHSQSSRRGSDKSIEIVAAPEYASPRQPRRSLLTGVVPIGEDASRRPSTAYSEATIRGGGEMNQRKGSVVSQQSAVTVVRVPLAASMTAVSMQTQTSELDVILDEEEGVEETRDVGVKDGPALVKAGGGESLAVASVVGASLATATLLSKENQDKSKAVEPAKDDEAAARLVLPDRSATVSPTPSGPIEPLGRESATSFRSSVISTQSGYESSVSHRSSSVLSAESSLFSDDKLRTLMDGSTAGATPRASTGFWNIVPPTNQVAAKPPANAPLSPPLPVTSRTSRGMSALEPLSSSAGGISPIHLDSRSLDFSDDEDDRSSGFITAPESQRSRSRRHWMVGSASESENDSFRTAQTTASSRRSVGTEGYHTAPESLNVGNAGE